MKHLAAALLVGSAMAFLFLGYSLMNLDRLGIGLTHPRVLVEAGLGIVLAAGGLLLLR